ncbi:hypothetical protein WA026_007211, partial [Henosepilachna vigintioctopunctata]
MSVRRRSLLAGPSARTPSRAVIACTPWPGLRARHRASSGALEPSRSVVFDYGRAPCATHVNNVVVYMWTGCTRHPQAARRPWRVSAGNQSQFEKRSTLGISLNIIRFIEKYLLKTVEILLYRCKMVNAP